MGWWELVFLRMTPWGLAGLVWSSYQAGRTGHAYWWALVVAWVALSKLAAPRVP